MGCFPYACPICGGGYIRCGKQCEHVEIDDDDEVYLCPGGQFCWDDNLIVKIKGINGQTYYLKGIYVGYGYVEIEENDKSLKIYSSEFSEYFSCWGSVTYIAESFICERCFCKSGMDDKIKLSKLKDIINFIPQI